LDEGIEGTLMLHWLSVLTTPGISLRIAKGLEALSAQLGYLPDKVEGDRRIEAQCQATGPRSEGVYP